MPPPFPHIAPLGETAFTIALGDTVEPELHRRILVLAAALRTTLGGRVEEIVPAFAAVSVFFDPLRSSFTELAALAAPLATEALTSDAPPAPRGRHWDIPARYDGPDLAAIAEATNFTVDEVVARHAAPTYTVYCLGFSPGFAYLGPLDNGLVLPRRIAPRRRIEPGSIAIAGRQTAIYPLPTPGGWHLLGRTDLRLFDSARTPAALLAPGDTVRFVPV